MKKMVKLLWCSSSADPFLGKSTGTSFVVGAATVVTVVVVLSIVVVLVSFFELEEIMHNSIIYGKHTYIYKCIQIYLSHSIQL